MKKYELMTIAKITLGEDGARALSNSIKDLISSTKGKVLNSDFWGKRKFAYEINHNQEGFYEVIDFEIEADAVATLKNQLNLQDGLVRYLISATK
ncbi:30S ribosomal protein S6 [candidate division WWE3 bacterium RIFCSPHIGHO2_01_FULL_42_13]|uniref:Small ribosomal subunit protein bS6 n=1 Tax=candidate division WWE3 bacterium RIFCSPHIGHO2_01_FULL_42_13 TaxID=1802617 RepID=A0A1F4URN4_UNCKA|nr:MAG: 30S ribosomal protein S6 [candidate division WWE3 bacterium RIFCSPHIGHO2_01_FULL_42_13]